MNDTDKLKGWVKTNELKFNRKNSGGCVSGGKAQKVKDQLGWFSIVQERRNEDLNSVNGKGCE